MINALSCDGVLAFTVEGAPVCSGQWLLSPLPEQFDLSQLDPSIIASAFTAGFVIVGSCWFAGWACKSILSILK